MFPKRAFNSCRLMARERPFLVPLSLWNPFFFQPAIFPSLNLARSIALWLLPRAAVGRRRRGQGEALPGAREQHRLCALKRARRRACVLRGERIPKPVGKSGARRSSLDFSEFLSAEDRVREPISSSKKNCFSQRMESCELWLIFRIC